MKNTWLRHLVRECFTYEGESKCGIEQCSLLVAAIIGVVLLAVSGTVGAMTLTHSGFMGNNGSGMMNGQSANTFRTGGAGIYTFRCLTPCGNGPMGMMGSIQTQGYMLGTLTVQ